MLQTRPSFFSHWTFKPCDLKGLGLLILLPSGAPCSASPAMKRHLLARWSGDLFLSKPGAKLLPVPGAPSAAASAHLHAAPAFPVLAARFSADWHHLALSRALLRAHACACGASPVPAEGGELSVSQRPCCGHSHVFYFFFPTRTLTLLGFKIILHIYQQNNKTPL